MKRALPPLGTVLIFLASGAALAGGAIWMARWLAPPIVHDLGADAGAGFAQGVARAQAQLQETFNPQIAGDRGRYA